MKIPRGISMRRTAIANSVFLAMVIAPLCFLPSSASAQDKNWKESLTMALKEAFPNSKTSALQKNNVTQQGVVLIVKKAGIMAQSVYSSSFPASTAVDGQVSGPKGMGALFSSRPRELSVGEKVYVRDIDVSDERVRFELLTTDMYDVVRKGSTERDRFLARLDFHFPKGTLAAMRMDALREVVGEIVISESAASAPKTIELGQTIADVEKNLGQPETVIRLGTKTTYVYKNMKVVFESGKVADVQ